MAHRSVSSADLDTDSDVDPFWHDAYRRRPPLLDRAAVLTRPFRSWAIVILGIVAAAGAGWWLLRPGAPPIESALPSAQAADATGSASPASASGSSGAPGGDGGSAPAAGATTSTTSAPLVVQAAGAVAKPGVYTLDPGARVDDLVGAAGGLTEQADVDRVNLAAPVADGERVWVPSRGETFVPDVVAGAGGGAGGPAGEPEGKASGGAGTAAEPASPVDLNTATADDLDALPGVGPATATAILAYRDEHGRFGSVEELLDVRGIGEAKLEQLRPLVRV